MSINYKQKAIDLLIKHIPNISIDNIKKIELLSGGFTNHCFYFEIDLKKRNKYFVRIGNSKINRTHEFSYLKASKAIDNYIYYDFENGDAIKIWQEGNVSTAEDCCKFKIFSQIVKEIKKIQSIKLNKVPNIKIRDFYQFIDIAKIDDIYINKYKEIIEKYKNLDLVVSHNDIRPSNILINKNKVIIIDFEWCTLSNRYWDLSNLVRELEFPLSELNKIFNKYFKKLNFNILKEMIFASSCFAVQWTFFEKETDELLAYRKNAIRVMEKYYNLFFEN